MKILYFISAWSHGIGGHYISLDHITKSIGKQNDIKIITIGPGTSGIITENPYFLKHIYFNVINILIFVFRIKQIIKKIRPDVIHCFDASCYNIIRLFLSTRKHKIVLTKAGGPNHNSYPFVNNLVLFSKENLNWFSSNQKFKDTIIHFIPNRVSQLEINKHYIPIAKEKNVFVFIRICRINCFYVKGIYDSINIIEYLNSKGIKQVKLFIIGIVEDEIIYRQIKNNYLVKNNKIILLTEPEYTLGSSKMLYLADAVIGTGRGFMEAASLGLPLLAINSEDDYPVLVTKDNFYDTFTTNFSERNVFKSYNKYENLYKIKLLINDRHFYNNCSVFSLEIFNKYFNVEEVIQAYSSVYKNTIIGKRKLFPDLILILYSVKRYFVLYDKVKAKISVIGNFYRQKLKFLKLSM